MKCLEKFYVAMAWSNQTFIHDVCHVTDDVMGCLATEEQHHLPVYSEFIMSIMEKLEMLKEHVCHRGKLRSLSFCPSFCNTFYTSNIFGTLHGRVSKFHKKKLIHIFVF